MKVDYLSGFINNNVNEFVKLTNNLEDSYIILPNLYKEKKPSLGLKFDFVIQMKISPKTLFKNLVSLLTINSKNKKKIKKGDNIFPLNDKNMYPCCKLIRRIAYVKMIILMRHNVM